MLVVTRRAGQILHIGPDIVVRVLDIPGRQVRLGIEAPDEVVIERGEIVQGRPGMRRWSKGATDKS